MSQQQDASGRVLQNYMDTQDKSAQDQLAALKKSYDDEVAALKKKYNLDGADVANSGADATVIGGGVQAPAASTNALTPTVLQNGTSTATSQTIYNSSLSNTVPRTANLAVNTLTNTSGTLSPTTTLGMPFNTNGVLKMSDSVTAKDWGATYLTSTDAGDTDQTLLTEADGDGIPLNSYWSKENLHEYNVSNIGRCLTELKKLKALYEQNAFNLSEENAHRFSTEEIKAMYSEQITLTKEICDRQQWLSGRFTVEDRVKLTATYIGLAGVGALDDVNDILGSSANLVSAGIFTIITRDLKNSFSKYYLKNAEYLE